MEIERKYNISDSLFYKLKNQHNENDINTFRYRINKINTRKHQFHGYWLINAFAKNKYVIVWTDNHFYLCCKY